MVNHVHLPIQLPAHQNTRLPRSVPDCRGHSARDWCLRRMSLVVKLYAQCLPAVLTLVDHPPICWGQWYLWWLRANCGGGQKGGGKISSKTSNMTSYVKTKTVSGRYSNCSFAMDVRHGCRSSSCSAVHIPWMSCWDVNNHPSLGVGTT